MRDFGSEYLTEIQDQLEKELAEGYIPHPEEAGEVGESPYLHFFTKIKPTWSYSDQQAIEQLKMVSSRLFLDIFGDSLSVLDDFYATIRIPQVNEHGVVLLDDQGRPRYQVDKTGQPLEDWSSLNGQDVEKCLFDLQRLKMIVANRCSELFLEAVFAKHILSDEHHAGYEKMVDGTVGDREARARRESTTPRYHAYFRYFLWYRCNTFLTELKETMRLLERVRQWRIMEMNNDA